MFLDKKNTLQVDTVDPVAARTGRLLARVVMVVAALHLATAFFSEAEAVAQQGEFKVVVSARNPLSEIDKDQLSKLFLKRARKSDAQPVDQSEDSQVRQVFSKEIHGRSVKAIKSYWLRMIFSGDASAPPELGSDQAVLSYIAANGDAIGYVGADVAIPGNLKEVAIID